MVPGQGMEKVVCKNESRTSLFGLFPYISSGAIYYFLCIAWFAIPVYYSWMFIT